MDYETARQFLIMQGSPSPTNGDAFLNRLKDGKPPVPGQVTSILLAVKMVHAAREGTPSLSREFAGPLCRLAVESNIAYQVGLMSGVPWPPLLAEDLQRIGRGIASIMSGNWQE
ncbi:MAG: Dethiobiotin synthetase [Cyanophyceae cyanobacterium]